MVMFAHTVNCILSSGSNDDFWLHESYFRGFQDEAVLPSMVLAVG